MKSIGILLVLIVMLSCKVNKKERIVFHNNRVGILGRDFSNSEVLSIDIVEIEHPMLGGIVETIKVPAGKKDEFLTKFDNLNKKGLYKCRSKYIVRLNMEIDTLRLKVCETLVANRSNDMYYELADGKSLIEDYIGN